MHLSPPPLAVCANQMGLNVTHQTDAALLRRQQPDALVVCDYGVLLPSDFLSVARLGALNVHPSLLPSWRGAAPVERAILAGDEKTGVTIMRLNQQLDAGDILAQQETPITPQTTGGSLRLSLAEMGASLLLRVLAETNAFPPRPQQAALSTYAAKIKPRERLLNFSQPAEAVRRKVAAFAPQPCAHCFLSGIRVKVHQATIVAGDAVAGTLLAANDVGIVIACKDGALQIRRLQKAGGNPMSAADFLHGFPLSQKIGKIVVD